MELRSGKAASSVASQPPQGDETPHAPAGSASPSPPVLSPQVTASEALSMLGTQEIADTELLVIADTLVSLGQRPLMLLTHDPSLLRLFLHIKRGLMIFPLV